VNVSEVESDFDAGPLHKKRKADYSQPVGGVTARSISEANRQS
jgi:hypothetical protein